MMVCLILPMYLSAVNYVQHTVRKGDTLYALSKRYGVSVDEIKKLNGMSDSSLSIGQKLKMKPEDQKQPTPKPIKKENPEPKTTATQNPTVLPGTLTGDPAAISAPLEDTESASIAKVHNPSIRLPEDYYYSIQPKDNLYRVSLKFNVKLKDMLTWNGFADEKQLIRQGDRIIIKDPASYNTEDPEAPIKPISATSVAESDTVLIQRVYVVQRKDTLYKIATENGMTVEDLKRINSLTSNEIAVGQKLNLVTPRGSAASEQGQNVVTEETIRTKDKIRGDLRMPVEGKVLSEFGIRNGRPHKGIDLGAKSGTPIYAVLDGTVVFSGYQGAYGNVVVIEHPDFVMSVYAHNEKNLVSVNDVITKGQNIATVGATGNASGPHLHFEYRIKGKAISPRKVLPME
jgi:murein DD-endopeptidase MepM/ murein hydrolase activator NlpD